MTERHVLTGERRNRWGIVRSLLVFQYKLLIDAFKDLLLSPLAFAAALVDIIRAEPASRMLFPEVMRLGRRAERAINLFGRSAEDDTWTVDRLVEGLESGLRQRYMTGEDDKGEQGADGKGRTGGDR